MKNSEKLIKWTIDTYQKRLKKDSCVEAITKVTDGLVRDLMNLPEIGNEIWNALNWAQSMIEHEVGIKESIRDSLIRKCKTNGGNMRDLLKELYYHLPTESEAEEKDRIIAQYNITGSKHFGIIIDVKADRQSLSRIIQGINHDKTPFYENSPSYFGGNGTYREGYPEVELFLFLVVKLKGHPHVRIDVRSDSLRLNERSKVTDRFVNELQNKLKGLQVEIVRLPDGSRQDFDLVNKDLLKLAN
jgi:hypothetical protein